MWVTDLINSLGFVVVIAAAVFLILWRMLSYFVFSRQNGA